MRKSSSLGVGLTGARKTPFSRYLTLANGTTFNVVADYSGAATDFFFEPEGTAVTAYVNQINITYSDTDIAQGVAISTVFAGSNALTNGIWFTVKNSAGTVLSWISDSDTTNFALKNNSQLINFFNKWWLLYPDASTTSANNELIFSLTLDFNEAFGAPLILSQGQRLTMTVQDNYTGSQAFYARVNGFYYS
jgi:hypothetical protein